MADDLTNLMRSAAATAVPVVRGIADDQLDRPTPCAEYDVRALLNHLFDVVVAFQAKARKEPGDMSPDPQYLTGDWRTRFDTEVAALVKEWSAPEALEGTSGPMNLPQTVLAQMVIVDLTVHSWDLARATGQPHQVDQAVAERLLETFTEMAPMGRKMGAFGDPVDVPAEAPVFDRLLGLMGRDPEWRSDR